MDAEIPWCGTGVRPAKICTGVLKEFGEFEHGPLDALAEAGNVRQR